MWGKDGWQRGGDTGDRRGGTEVGTLGQMWWHYGDGERMGGTEVGTLGADVTLQWGHWGHDGWHHIGDSGTDVVAPR